MSSDSEEDFLSASEGSEDEESCTSFHNNISSSTTEKRNSTVDVDEQKSFDHKFVDSEEYDSSGKNLEQPAAINLLNVETKVIPIVNVVLSNLSVVGIDSCKNCDTDISDNLHLNNQSCNAHDHACVSTLATETSTEYAVIKSDSELCEDKMKSTSNNQLEKKLQSSDISDVNSADQVTSKIEQKDSSSNNRPNRRETKVIKKPREKLGERIGAKKLGSRTSKPLVGISSDSFQHPNSSDHTPEEEINRKQQWKDQQEYWNKQDVFQVKQNETTNWNSWGNWGTDLFSAASSLTKEVSKGMNTVVQTVESGLGIPLPEEMAKEIVEKERKLEETEVQESNPNNIAKSSEAPGFGFGGLVSLVTDVSGVLESAGNKMIVGGLDTLELIGRKTMDVLREKDPQLKTLKRKVNFLSARKDNLSTLLQEARMRAIETEKHVGYVEEKRSSDISLSSLWNDTEWAAHYEALSLLAEQSETRMKSLINSAGTFKQEELNSKISALQVYAEIDEQERINSEDELIVLLEQANLPISLSNVKESCCNLDKIVSSLCIELPDSETQFELKHLQLELYKGVVTCVGQLISVMHKIAQLTFINSDLDWMELSTTLNDICGAISSQLEVAADNVCNNIAKSSAISEEALNKVITSIYLQIADANEYLQQSLENFISVLVFLMIKAEDI